MEIITDQLSFIGKPVIVSGILEPSSYYNYGYAGAEDTHLSFRLWNRDNVSHDIYLYMRRGEAANNLRQKLLANGGKMEGSFTFVILRERYAKEDTSADAELIDYKLSP